MSAPSAVSLPTSSRWSRWRACSGLMIAAEQQHEHRHADQHDQPEHDRRRDEDHADDDVGDDRAREARRDVVGAARAHRVVRDGGDDLAGRERPAHGRAGPGRVVRDELREPERGLEPVEDRVAMPHHPCKGLHQAEHQQRERPDREVAVRALDDPELDRAADRERHQRLREHPPDPEEDPERERALLVLADPDNSRTGERVSGLPGSATGISIRLSMAKGGPRPAASAMVPVQYDRDRAATAGTARYHVENTASTSTSASVTHASARRRPSRMRVAE